MAISGNLGDFAARPDPSDPRWAGEVFQRFTQRLVGLARSRLDPRLMAKVDAEDVARQGHLRHREQPLQRSGAGQRAGDGERRVGPIDRVALFAFQQ